MNTTIAQSIQPLALDTDAIIQNPASILPVVQQWQAEYAATWRHDLEEAFKLQAVKLPAARFKQLAGTLVYMVALTRGIPGEIIGQGGQREFTPEWRKNLALAIETEKALIAAVQAVYPACAMEMMKYRNTTDVTTEGLAMLAWLNANETRILSLRLIRAERQN